MNFLEKFKDIRVMMFDVDGVLTDNNLIVLENGHLLRTMNIRDGYAIKRALLAGYKIAVITGGRSSGVEARLRNLGVTDIFSGIEDKLPVYESLVAKYNLDEGEILYMGDDLPDLTVMRRVGLPVCPSDAIPEIMEVCQYISPFDGGKGAVRDVIEKVLRLQNLWLP